MQEIYIRSEMLFNSFINQLGNWMLPAVNSVANYFLDEEAFPHYSEDFQRTTNVYPGEEW